MQRMSSVQDPTGVASMESELDEIEAQMNKPLGVGGTQAFTSLGERLRDLERRAEAGQVPDTLLERLRRVILAHRARCPPHELGRRLSHQSLSRQDSPLPRSDSAVSSASVSGLPIIRRPTLDDAMREMWGGGNGNSVAETPRELVRMQSNSTFLAAADPAAVTASASLADPGALRRQTSGGNPGQVGTISFNPPQPPAIHDLGAAADTVEDAMEVEEEEEKKESTGKMEEVFDGGSSNSHCGGSSSSSVAAVVSSEEEGVSTTALYAWGRGDLGALPHSDTADHLAANALVTLRSQLEIVQVSTSKYHTMLLAGSGDLFGCGSNEEGQVRSDRVGVAAAGSSSNGAGGGSGGEAEKPVDLPAPAATFVSPTLVEPLQTHPVVAVACGMLHTAVVTASGAVLAWGGNESGQLGHSGGMVRAQPKVVQGSAWSGRQRAIGVACGDLYTLVLTVAGQVLSCGIGDCVGCGDGKSRSRAEVVKALATVPVVALAAGPHHAVAISATGAAYSWGVNSHNQCGVGPPPPKAPPGYGAVPGAAAQAPSGSKGGVSGGGGVSGAANASSIGGGARENGGENEEQEAEAMVLSPLRIRGTGPIPSVDEGDDAAALPWGPLPVAAAACGQNHTVLITTDGRVVACGRNRRGALGLDPAVHPVARRPTLVPLAAASRTPADGSGDCSLVVTQVAAGEDHTLLLTADGRLLAAGANDAMQLGLSPAAVAAAWAALPTFAPGADDGSAMAISGGDEDTGIAKVAEKTWFWRFTEVPELCGTGVKNISAGGSQSFALVQRRQAGATPTAAAGTARAAAAPGPRATPLLAAGPDITHIMDMATAASLSADDRRQLIRAIHDTFGSANALNASFLKAVPAASSHNGGNGSNTGGGSGRDSNPGGGGSNAGGEGTAVTVATVREARVLDVEGLEAMYVALIRLGADVISALASAIATGVAEMDAYAASLTEPDALRCLLAWWQCPIHGSPAASIHPDGSGTEAFIKLCGVMLSLPYEGHRRLMGWVQTLYPAHIFASRLLRPLQVELSRHLNVERGRGVAIPTASLVAQWLYAVNNVSHIVPFEQFYNADVSALPTGPLFSDLMQWKKASQEDRRRHFFFCSYSFLLSLHAKKQLIQLEAATEQQMAAQMSGGQIRLDPTVGLVFTPGRPFLVIVVERSHLLAQTLRQVADAPDQDLSKEMKVVFAGEEGVDAGGVRKEFFQLLIGQLFDVSFGMFLEVNNGRELWFNRDCTWCEEEYNLIGVLMGLAVYNAVLLDINFPVAVYKKLLAAPVALDDLDDIDPELRRGLQALLDYPGDDVEEVFCRTFEVTWDDFGQPRSYELKSGGGDMPVTSQNKEEYVRLYASWLLSDSVAFQFDAFRRGFDRVMGRASLGLLRAEELELLVAGQPHLDFKALEKVAKYEGGYGPDNPTIKEFWNFVQGMDLTQQRKLLLFVTGGSKAPVGGLGSMEFKIQRAGPDSEQLPTASTCFNILLLPEYATRERLRDRLLIALNECQGFGLQ